MLKSVILYVRNVSQTVTFYSEGLGMNLVKTVALSPSTFSASEEEKWAEAILHTPPSIPLILHRTEHEALHSIGCSPLLAFHIAELDVVLPKLLLRGAHMDGKIHYSLEGKMARLRTPDGHMIALYEIYQPSHS
jgi:catechol 2,3-dioxygenase-like lactoylglutathione lyase family enzyme